jgi:hypothetical protein
MEAVNQKTTLKKKNKRNDILKVIAMVTMLIDHIGYLFLPSMMIFRTIGRIAFPIFAYLIGIGYDHTSSLKKYVLRLFIFALVTQIPYSFFNRNLTFEPYNLNILFTLVLGLIFIHLINDSIQLLKGKGSIKYLRILMNISVLFMILYINEFVKFVGYGRGLEYGWYGIVLILIFYYTKGHTILLITNYIVLTFAHAYYNIFISLAKRSQESPLMYLMNNSGLIFSYIFSNVKEILNLSSYFFQGRSIMALYFIKVFDQEKFFIRLNPWIGYIFYPGHMTLLILLRYLMK